MELKKRKKISWVVKEARKKISLSIFIILLIKLMGSQLKFIAARVCFINDSSKWQSEPFEGHKIISNICFRMFFIFYQLE